jgi:hypothetical protein
MSRIVGVLVLVVVLAAGIGIGLLGRSWWSDRPQTGSGADAASSTSAVRPTSVPRSVAAAPPVTLIPTRPALPTSTPAERDVVVEVSESQLQSQLSGMLVGHSLGATPLGDATIQSVTVQLRDSQVRVGGGAKAGFLNAPFTAAGTVEPDPSGRPIVSVSEAAVGGVLLPVAARTALAESLQLQVDGLFAERSMKVRAIDIANGRMRVVGTAGS